MELQTAAEVTVRMAATQIASYKFVLAIQGPFLLALIGAAATLRRPGTRSLALVYGLYSVSAVSSALIALIRFSSGVEAQALLAVALTGFLIGAAWAATQHASLAMAGLSVSRWPNTYRMLIAGLVTGGVLSGLSVLPFGGATGPIVRRVAERAFIVALMLQASIATWYAMRRTTQNHQALRMVVIGLVAVVARQLFNIFIDLKAGGNNPVSVETIIVASATTSVINGVAFLLAAMLEERTAILAQSEQLRVAEAQLGAARRLESLGQMAGGIAHDFANVLTVIAGAFSTARGEVLPSRVRSDLETADAALERATALTRQLSDYAQNRQNQRVRFNAGSRLRSLTPVLQRLTGERIAFSAECCAELAVTLDMEPSQFDQVSLNLVINARDAMPEGGALVLGASDDQVSEALITTTGLLAPGRYLRLRVEDTGVGIRADALPHIFEPFYTTKGDRGTGLGLATVFSVVQRARGQIAVTSTEGRGTRFDVWLPVAD